MIRSHQLTASLPSARLVSRLMWHAFQRLTAVNTWEWVQVVVCLCHARACRHITPHTVPGACLAANLQEPCPTSAPALSPLDLDFVIAELPADVQSAIQEALHAVNVQVGSTLDRGSRQPPSASQDVHEVPVEAGVAVQHDSDAAAATHAPTEANPPPLLPSTVEQTPAGTVVHEPALQAVEDGTTLSGASNEARGSGAQPAPQLAVHSTLSAAVVTASTSAAPQQQRQRKLDLLSRINATLSGGGTPLPAPKTPSSARRASASDAEASKSTSTAFAHVAAPHTTLAPVHAQAPTPVPAPALAPEHVLAQPPQVERVSAYRDDAASAAASAVAKAVRRGDPHVSGDLPPVVSSEAHSRAAHDSTVVAPVLGNGMVECEVVHA
ncbi:hypothetical protein EON66_05930, partial [archaeon]